MKPKENKYYSEAEIRDGCQRVVSWHNDSNDLLPGDYRDFLLGYDNNREMWFGKHGDSYKYLYSWRSYYLQKR